MERSGYPGFATPEEAARGDIPARYARVAKIVYRDVDHALVELATNEPPYEYPYFVHVERVDGLWYEGPSHN